MFKVGEKVVYPAHGVGEIEAIRSHVISGTERKFYMLRILETDMKIMIPIDNVDSVGLRKIIDRAMVTKVYKVLRRKKLNPTSKPGTAATANTLKRSRLVRFSKLPKCCVISLCSKATKSYPLASERCWTPRATSWSRSFPSRARIRKKK